MDYIKFIEDNWVVVLVFALILVSLTSKNKKRVVDFRVANQPERVDELIENIDTKGFFISGPHIKKTVIQFTSAEPEFQSMMKALEKGNRIDAIKIIREAKGLDLTTAKQLVDVIAESRRHIEQK